MRRREFIALFGASVVWASAAGAQHQRGGAIVLMVDSKGFDIVHFAAPSLAHFFGYESRMIAAPRLTFTVP
jgi:hypothetical protein